MFLTCSRVFESLFLFYAIKKDVVFQILLYLYRIVVLGQLAFESEENGISIIM